MGVVYIVKIEKEIVGIEIESSEMDVVLKLSKSDVQDIVDKFEYLDTNTVFKWKKQKEKKNE